MRAKALFFALCAFGSLQAYVIDQVNARIGYSNAYKELKEDQQIDVDTVKSDGWIYDLSMGFNVSDSGFFSVFKPYIDLTGRYYEDRNVHTVGAGLYHNFGFIGPIEPYVSAGVGYGLMGWKNAPISNTKNKDTSSGSFVGTVQGGAYLAVHPNVMLSVGLRLDAYDFATQYKIDTHTKTQRDRMAVSALAGVTFVFETEDDGSKASGSADAAATPVTATAAETAPSEPETTGKTSATAAAEATTAAVVPAVVPPPCDLHDIPTTIRFGFNSNELDAPSKQTLDTLADCSKEHPDTRITFEGHADSTGPAAYNKKLSQKRAETARDYGVAAGIKPEQTRVTARGESMPVADNDTEEGRSANRRVEIYFVDRSEPMHFAYNSASIQPILPKLEELLTQMQADETMTISIVGHTDSIGSEAFNMKLGERRAKAVAEFLTGNGIDTARIHIASEGETKPVADNGSEDGRAKNRRTEMELKY